MPINASDAHRALKIASPLGDELVCRAFTGQERLGRLFDYRLDLLSLNPNIQFNDIVGQRVTITLEMDSGDRYFDGFVTEFWYLGTSGQFAAYAATLKPWLWFLSRTADCRIFQNETVPDIIKKVFRDNGTTDFEDRLIGSYRQWEYCVQYRETDFNFVSRLMEQEGIYYFFEHSQGKHTLVMADDISAHGKFPGYETVPFYPPDGNAALRERDHIQHWAVTQSIQPGKYAIQDFNFEKPKVDLTARLTEIRPHPYLISDPEIYDYPGEYPEVQDGTEYVERKLQELQCQHERVNAGGSARGMCSGYLFKLENYSRLDQNKEYLIVAVSHSVRNDPVETDASGATEDFYSCQIELLDKSQPYRSERITPKPIVQGPQTAIVVGKSTEEIDPDKYGRVKVQFHWDRYGEHDENSSCWIRVSQIWAGKNWGGIHIPRIGHEVVVSFLEGDPDRPLITGCVYNADNMPPYDLPANKTQSGIKSRSSKKGNASHFNEIRFEDKKDKEEIYVHAEKNLTAMVENIEKRHTFNSRHATIGSKDNPRPAELVEELLVYGMRIINVRGDDGLVVSEGQNGRKVQIIDGSYDLEVQKEDYKLAVTMGDASTKVDLGNIDIEAATGKITLKATQSIELVVGPNSIKIDPSGVTVKGIMVRIN